MRAIESVLFNTQLSKLFKDVGQYEHIARQIQVVVLAHVFDLKLAPNGQRVFVFSIGYAFSAQVTVEIFLWIILIKILLNDCFVNS